MDEILFENRYMIDEAMNRDYLSWMFFRRPAQIVFHILFLLYFLFAVIAVCAGFGGVYSWLLLLLVAAVFALQIVRYRRAVKNVRKNIDELYGGTPPEGIVTVTDRLFKSTLSNGAVSQIELRHLTSARRAGNLILLRSDGGLLFVFPADTFTTGSPDAFLAFLRGKGVKIR